MHENSLDFSINKVYIIYVRLCFEKFRGSQWK